MSAGGRARVAALLVSAGALGCGASRTRTAPLAQAEVLPSPCDGGHRPEDCRPFVDELLARAVLEPERMRVERRTLARALANREVRVAKSRGAAPPEEAEAAAERIWPKLNDGPIVSVVHALFPEGPHCVARAEAFAREVGPAPEPKAFEARARALGDGIVVENIAHVGNRRKTAAGMTLEAAFADAAVALTTKAPRSDVVRTRYGAHLLVLTARIDAPPTDAKARALLLSEEVIALRVRDALAEAASRRPRMFDPGARETLKNLDGAR